MNETAKNIDLECKKMESTIAQLSDQLSHVRNRLQDCSLRPSGWIPAKMMLPQEGEKVVVWTRKGAIYFESVINGSFLSDVLFWYPLPPCPHLKEHE